MRAFVVVLVALLLAAAPPARADEARARARFVEAQRAFDEGRVDDALAGFEAAYEDAPRPELLFNIGQCLLLLDRPEEAARAFERYLGARPDGPQAYLAHARLDEARWRASTRAAVPTPAIATAPPDQAHDHAHDDAPSPVARAAERPDDAVPTAPVEAPRPPDALRAAHDGDVAVVVDDAPAEALGGAEADGALLAGAVGVGALVVVGAALAGGVAWAVMAATAPAPSLGVVDWRGAR